MFNTIKKKSLLTVIIILSTAICALVSASVFASAHAISNLVTNPLESGSVTSTSSNSGFVQDGNNFYIYDRAGLIEFRNQVNKGEPFTGCTVTLMADIDLSYISSWIPIGGAVIDNATKSFQGTFDGNGYMVSNLNLNNRFYGSSELSGVSHFVGLGFFGVTTNAIIQNLMLNNVNITNEGNIFNTVDNLGSLIGAAMSTSVYNCMVYNVNVNIEGDGGQQGFGGLVGMASNVISDYSIAGDFQNCIVVANNINIETIDQAVTIGGIVGSVVGLSPPWAEFSNTNQVPFLISRCYFYANSIRINCSQSGTGSPYHHFGGMLGANIYNSIKPDVRAYNYGSGLTGSIRMSYVYRAILDFTTYDHAAIHNNFCAIGTFSTNQSFSMVSYHPVFGGYASEANEDNDLRIFYDSTDIGYINSTNLDPRYDGQLRRIDFTCMNTVNGYDYITNNYLVTSYGNFWKTGLIYEHYADFLNRIVTDTVGFESIMAENIGLNINTGIAYGDVPNFYNSLFRTDYLYDLIDTTYSNVSSSTYYLPPFNASTGINGIPAYLPILRIFCSNIKLQTCNIPISSVDDYPEHIWDIEVGDKYCHLRCSFVGDFSDQYDTLYLCIPRVIIIESFVECWVNGGNSAVDIYEFSTGTVEVKHESYVPKYDHTTDNAEITFEVMFNYPDIRLMVTEEIYEYDRNDYNESTGQYNYTINETQFVTYEGKRLEIEYTISIQIDVGAIRNSIGSSYYVFRLSDVPYLYPDSNINSFTYVVNNGRIIIKTRPDVIAIGQIELTDYSITPVDGVGQYNITGFDWGYSQFYGNGRWYEHIEPLYNLPTSKPFLSSAHLPWTYIEPIFKFEPVEFQVYVNLDEEYGSVDPNPITFNPISGTIDITQTYNTADNDSITGYQVVNGSNTYKNSIEIFPWYNGERLSWYYVLDNNPTTKSGEFKYNETAEIDVADVDQRIDIYFYGGGPPPKDNIMYFNYDYNLKGRQDNTEDNVNFSFSYFKEYDLDEQECLDNPLYPIDLTGATPIIINGVEKYFADWVIRYDSNGNVYDYLGNVIARIDSYTTYEHDSVLTIRYENGEDIRVWNFLVYNDFDTFTDIENHGYYVVQALLEGSYGDAPSPFILAYWSNTYTLHIENDGTEGLGSSIWDNLSEPTNYYGVGGSGSNIKVYSNLTELDMTIRHSSTYAYPFMTSEYKNRGLSMRTRDDFERLSATNLPNCDNNYYYIFNYGYRINGYYISFRYKNRPYYLTYQGGAWGCSSSRKPVYISNLSNDDLADMSLYAERLDELNAGGVPSNTTITMIPIWQAVKIQLTSSNTIWQGKFNTNYNTSSYVNTSLGTTIGYFTAGASGVYIMPSTGNIPYNYYNVPYNLYNDNISDINNPIYTILISPHLVNNIYRVDLTGYKDKDNYYTLTGDTDYSFVSPTLSTYLITYQDEDGYETYSRAKYRFANDYASYIYDVITNYEGDISDGSHDALRKVFVNGGAVTNETSINSSGVTGMYIYLANACSTGDLPIFDSTYEILIYWANTETSSDGSRYAYTTSAYNQHDHGLPQYAENSDYITPSIWQLTDGYQSISQGSSQITKVTFEAFYFRKVYYMDVSTAFDNTNDVNQYGYVRIDVNDATEALNTVDDKSADYLVIYLNDGMKYYDVTGMSFSSIADINFNRLTELDELPVYAGCDVTITAYDQSKDSRAMLTGYYFDQIGYKYSEIASNRDVFDSTAYSHSATAEEIDSENMDTGDHINVTVYFDYVNYNLSIRMETGDRTEGTFVVTYSNGAVSGSLTTASLTGLNVNNTVQITYRALSGYEFDDVAFSLLLNGREIELLSYNELKSAGSQTYVLTLDADWLYNIYYINFDTTFSIENTNLGTIQLNTDEIEFDYYVKLINGETNEELENRLLGTWQISDGTVSLANAFTNNGDMGYVIRINGEYYAATYSYAYLPRNPSNMTNHYQSYNFLLTELPTREYSISTDLLSYMTLSTIYEILDEDLRDIYMVVVVRKIVTIQFEVSEVTHDPDGERVVTITNGNSNSKQITVSSNYNTIGTIYSYVGQQNTISLTYNQNMYEGANYTYNDLQIDSSFVASEDGTIIIEFIPKPLNVRVEYYVNDSLQSDISDKLDIEFNHANEVYYCTESNHTDGQIQIIFTQKTQDYNLYIYINDVNQISSYNINTPHVINYRVTRSDVELGEIYIKVVEVEHNNEEITIEFALVDSKLSLPSDNFGSYTVIINDVAVESADSYRVYEGRKLQIQIDLNTGYAYYGVMHNNGLITSPELSNDNIITITTSFTESDGGRYRIYLNKTRINAELRMVGDTHRIYTMDANQSEGDGIVKTTTDRQDMTVVTLSNLYVGKVITFTRLRDDIDQQLNYYYYITSNGIQTIEGNTLAITSSLLNNIEGDLIIYVNTTNKYMVDLQVIEGSDYANIDYEQFYTNGNFVYFTEGTVIPFIITTIEEGRYDIVVTGDLQCTGDDINTKFTITKDMTIRVSITPKVYNTDDVTEYVFMEISDLENNDPQLVGEEDRNPIMSSNQTYNQEAYVRIDMNLSDRVLYIVKFTCEDIEFTLNLETNEMTANGEFTYENNVLTINGRTYRISITDNLLEISYTSHGDIQLELTYKSIKLIYPAGSND